MPHGYVMHHTYTQRCGGTAVSRFHSNVSGRPLLNLVVDDPDRVSVSSVRLADVREIKVGDLLILQIGRASIWCQYSASPLFDCCVGFQSCH